MRANIEEYKAVEAAALKFVKSVAEGRSAYARELFIDEAVLSAIWTAGLSMAVSSNSTTTWTPWQPVPILRRVSMS